MQEEAFSNLLAEVYGAAADWSRWPDVLQQLTSAFGTNCTVLGVTDERQCLSQYIAPLSDPHYLDTYTTYYYDKSPLMPRIRALPAGSVVTDRMVLPRPQFENSEIYNDWIVPQGIKHKLYTVLISNPGQKVIFGVHSGKEFDQRQLRLCRMLAPHLRQAAALGLRFQNLESFRAASIEALNSSDDGVILLGQQGEALFINTAAEALFSSHGGLRLDEGRIAAYSPVCNARLQRLIARSIGGHGAPAAGGQIEIGLADGDDTAMTTLTLHAMPLSAPASLALPRRVVAMLLFKRANPPPTAASLAARFGLTPAEASVAISICSGLSASETAQRFQTQISTVRTHISRIFGKTGTRRQADLVRVVLH